MGLISEQEIRARAASTLARALTQGHVEDQTVWCWRWCEENGVEPADLRLFTRAVVRRARAAMSGCTGYGPDPQRLTATHNEGAR
jgi:hypothetical protein